MTFPAVVAGDGGPNGRAAYAFFGTTTPGAKGSAVTVRFAEPVTIRVGR